MKRFPVTFALLFTSIALQIVYTVAPDLQAFGVFMPAAGPVGWIGLLPHMVSHANWDHLIGNFMFGLPFMAYLESKLGARNTLAYYVGCGLFAAFFQICLGGFAGGLIGSSGAIAGMFAGACIAFGDSKPEHAVSVCMLILFLVGQLASAHFSFDHVAYYAHVGGVVGGLILSTRLHVASAPLVPAK